MDFGKLVAPSVSSRDKVVVISRNGDNFSLKQCIGVHRPCELGQ